MRESYLAIRAAFPRARIQYAVKANPAPEILRLLIELGAGFDVASPAEIIACLALGAHPDTLSYGNTIKKTTDIAFAYQRGIQLFTTDSIGDLHAIAAHAPGSSVFCRVMVEPTGAATPFGRKFGCAQDMTIEVLREATKLGLRPRGVSFHVGSQQTSTTAWQTGIAAAAEIGESLARDGIELSEINIGGGFPVSYLDQMPPIEEYAHEIDRELAHYFTTEPGLLIEPGRAIVATAGVLRSTVILVSRKATSDEHRWVYLDVGRYGGLAETEGEAIAYPLATRHDQTPGPWGPIVLAGPTCDGDDVLYQRSDYRMPLALAAGEFVDFLCAGAYTASYASVSFNGFAPMETYCLPASHNGRQSTARWDG